MICNSCNLVVIVKDLGGTIVHNNGTVECPECQAKRQQKEREISLDQKVSDN